jgi:hypothetical protein
MSRTPANRTNINIVGQIKIAKSNQQNASPVFEFDDGYGYRFSFFDFFGPCLLNQSSFIASSRSL